MSSLNDIRAHFLDYFARRDHRIMPSAPLVPQADPTLLFTNAGMAPFKDVFTGRRSAEAPRAASAQKCLRAGGKHNDLDNVGYTARHHTFFEMLGNFSFGDYFKEQAIRLAWDLTAGEFKLPPDRLIVTVFAEDDEAFSLWRKISGLPEARILRLDSEDNFWSMGAAGPCGPCSEIFYDHGGHLSGAPPGSKGGDGGRFVEIWNLVFMQFNQDRQGRRTALPRPSIDTGMGLERMAAVLQGTHDNYATDLFRKLIAASAELTGGDAAADGHRVIADHLRAACFLIADGVLPSNEGRGYVLRRILRRAMRHAHELGAKEPVLCRLAPVLEEEMGGAYPELGRVRALIAEALAGEERRFQDMLVRGLALLEKEAASVGGGKILSGAAAFRLYDTYGFPLDLTQDALRGRGIAVDTAGFEQAMAGQREGSRGRQLGSAAGAGSDALWTALGEKYPATRFLGYQHDSGTGSIAALVADGREVEAIEAGSRAALVLDQTPFYGESGGQAGDTGVIETRTGEAGQGARFRVEETRKEGGLHVHHGLLESGRLSPGMEVAAAIDAARRTKIRANHSATHLMNEALRRVLGEHVVQKGSLVDADHLRFDFSHPKPLTAQEVEEIETLVNDRIRANAPVAVKEMGFDEARSAGALSLLGESYGDPVRVLFMDQGAGGGGRGGWSVELCGGTHVVRLGDIALFAITAQSAVGSGVRRIEARTGAAARRHLVRQQERLAEAARLLKIAPEQLPERLAALLEERKALEQALSQARRKLALSADRPASGGGREVETFGRIKFVMRLLEGIPPGELRALVDEAKRQLGSGVVAFAAVHKGKAGLAVGVTGDLADAHNAVELVRAGAKVLGGSGGGGRPDMAVSGGPDGARAQEALNAVREIIRAAA